MSDATFTAPDLTTFARLDQLGLEVTGQLLKAGQAVLACRVVEPDDWCHRCGCQGRPRGSVVRSLAHAPFGQRPTTLQVRVRRYTCTGCGGVWRQDTSRAAEPRAKLSRGGLAWALSAIVCQHLSMSRVAEALGVAWNTANDAVLAEGRRVLIDDPTRFEGVQILGVDEHVWRHTHRGDKYVTVIIDLTPTREDGGTARLLDLVEGRSGEVFAAWLEERPQAWREGIEVVAMDGFTGFKAAAAKMVPTAVTVMDPFHVVAQAGEAMNRCRQRVQRETCGRRSRKGDPLYRVRRALFVGDQLRTQRQSERITPVLADPAHAQLAVAWRAYQQMINDYRDKEHVQGRQTMADLIEHLNSQPPEQIELRKLGKTLQHRAEDVLAYFDHPGSSNGPTEAINGRLEHLRGLALGFRNLTHYITRALLESGGFRPQLHPQL